jgi:cellulose synthase/poly-beta-1,6-N-acetylglucosamine synthase-like glycosyltransferase
MDWKTIIWLACYLVVFVGLTAYGVHRYCVLFLYYKHSRTPPRPQRNFTELPTVTVQLPIFNEIHVIKRLLASVAALDYPRDRLQIQILDDSTDGTVELCRSEAERLRAAGYSVEHRHRTNRTGFKAGALEEGLASATGEFLFILDADFVPPPDILHRMVHFFTDDGIGMIQTRWGHLNRESSLLTRVQAMFLDGHLQLEQTARSRSGRFFNFNGTAGIWRKSCIADAGGWEHDTLTEDMDLSYRAQLKGWRFIFLNDVVTPAELPVDMDGFKSQQHRWTKGSIQTCKKILRRIWQSDFPLLIKLEATAHLTSNFAYLLLIFLCVYTLPFNPPGLPPGAGFWLGLPVFLIATVSLVVFYVTAQRALHPKTWWKELAYLPMLLALGIGMSINNGKAVLEALFNQQSGFVRTPKYGIEDNGKSAKKPRAGSSKLVPLILECVFGLWFTLLSVIAAMHGAWITVPFLMLFTVGFWYVAIGSLLPLLGGSRKDPEDLDPAVA